MDLAVSVRMPLDFYCKPSNLKYHDMAKLHKVTAQFLKPNGKFRKLHRGVGKEWFAFGSVFSKSIIWGDQEKQTNMGRRLARRDWKYDMRCTGQTIP
jgi:hypothetical protein